MSVLSLKMTQRDERREKGEGGMKQASLQPLRKREIREQEEEAHSGGCHLPPSFPGLEMLVQNQL